MLHYHRGWIYSEAVLSVKESILISHKADTNNGRLSFEVDSCDPSGFGNRKGFFLCYRYRRY